MSFKICVGLQISNVGCVEDFTFKGIIKYSFSYEFDRINEISLLSF